MNKNILLAVLVVTSVMSCTTKTEIPEMFSSVADTLSDDMHYALVDIGGNGQSLLVAPDVYDDLEGHNASIEARVFSVRADGTVADCGSLYSQGTSYPLAVRDGRIYTSGHRFIKQWTIDGGGEGLKEISSIVEVLDTLGYPVHYIIDKDMVCCPDDSLVEKMYSDWSEAEVISFKPVRE